VHAYDSSNRSIVALLLISCTLLIGYYYALESGVLYWVISL
jgi:NADH:ubiquinone oxidoreductase subunit 3 (subunit A)